MPEQSVEIIERSGLAVIRLQSWAATLGSGIERRSPTLVPPGLGDRVRILSLSPYEWLAVSDAIDGPSLHEHIWRYVAEQDIAAVDLSSATKVLRLEGIAAGEVLTRACGLDFHPQTFLAGRACRTRFAQLSAIIHCVDPSPRFDIYVDRSYLTYLRSWLQDSSLQAAQIETP